MTTSQFFVYRRPIAWTALIVTLVWGGFAYVAMPQRHDPVIPVRIGVVVTPYPGARAEKVEQEVTRKIERKLSENAAVEHVYSLSRQGLSIVFVELSEYEKNAEQVWQDLQGRLSGMSDLPRVADRPVTPRLDKDYGDTVAVMLTISSPPVSDLEIELRARNIREVLAPARAACAPDYRDNRVSGAVVYPDTVARATMLRIGRTLLQRLTEAGVARDGRILEAPSSGCIDFQLAGSLADLRRVAETWDRETQAGGQWHHDVWPPFLIRDLDDLPRYLRMSAREKYTYRELRQFADRIQDRLKRFPTVAMVRQIGVQEEQVTLSYSGQRFTQFGIRPDLIMSRLQQRNINLPGGRVELPQQNIVVQPSGEFKSEREIGDVVVALSSPDARARAFSGGGYPLYLRDLVDITRGYVDPPDVMSFRTIKVKPGQGKSQTPRHQLLPDAVKEATQPRSHAATKGGKGTGGRSSVASDLQTTRAITLAVRQVKGSHIADFARDIDRALAELEGVLPDDLRLERTSDEPATVRNKIAEFNQCLTEAVVLVVLIALVLMEWRSAVLVAVSIPVTVAMTLGICQVLGVDIQQISVGALIIALGLLVDDPVVAADAINRELGDGVPRDVAAWQGPQKLARAILYATLTNCVAFLPLLLVRGVMGEFIYSLPVVVAASLVASRIVSMTFLPLLGYYVLRGQRGFDAWLADGAAAPRAPTLAAHMLQAVARVFSRFTSWSLGHKWTVLAGFVAALAVCLGLTRFIGTAFFPKDLHSIFIVDVYLPEGTPIWETRAAAERIIAKIEASEGPHIHSYTTFVGEGGPRFWLSVAPEQRADNYAQILIHTAERRQTEAIVARLKHTLPPNVAAARVSVAQLETGPPIGVPVQIRIFGPDVEQLRSLARRVRDLLRAVPGSDSIHDDWDREILQISLNIDPERASITGVSNADAAGVVFAGLSGYPVTQMRERDRLIDVRLRLRSDERSGVGDLHNLYVISSLTNARVPLLQIADIHTELVSPKIWRRDHQRCLTVKCDAMPGVLPSRISAQLRARLPALDWPPGYRFEYGGEQEEQAKEFAKLARALLVSLLCIYLALVLQFNSTIKPLIVFAAVPFGLIGGLMGLLIFGAPFGFMAFLGVASLAGVIVSHIIVLFDYIEDMRQAGKPFRQALIAATLARLRPVLVTVLATVGGLIPLAVRGGPLWEPMCYVEIFGLLIAVGVTLVMVPALYAVFVESFRIVRWQRPTGDEFRVTSSA